MAETGWKRGRTNSDGYAGLPARLGSEALSLADPMRPPPSNITGRSNDPKGTPGLLGLSIRPTEILPAGLIARAYYRRENAGRRLIGPPEPMGCRASPRLYKTAPDGGNPALAEGKEPHLH